MIKRKSSRSEDVAGEFPPLSRHDRFTCLAISLGIGTTGSPVPHKSLIHVHAAFKPDAAQAGLQDSAHTYPGATTTSGSDINDTISAGHQRFAFARLHESYLMESRPIFSVTLTTIALNDSSSRWFGISS